MASLGQPPRRFTIRVAAMSPATCASCSITWSVCARYHLLSCTDPTRCSFTEVLLDPQRMVLHSARP